MTPEQRYMFDLTGYLHLENVLSDDELKNAQEATQRHMDTADEDLPPGFGRDGKRHLHGFAFDKCLEALTMHPTTWPIIMELTNDKPRLLSGTLLVDEPGKPSGGRLHCAREDYGWESTRYEIRAGRVYCDDFVVFPYLDDVLPRDGGLLLLPGSHKINFDRPKSLFNGGEIIADELPPGVINVTPKAGDVLVMPEAMTHGILTWTPEDRIRRILVLRYRPQHKDSSSGLPEEIKQRLSPETLELTETGSFKHVKEISKGRAAA